MRKGIVIFLCAAALCAAVAAGSIWKSKTQAAGTSVAAASSAEAAVVDTSDADGAITLSGGAASVTGNGLSVSSDGCVVYVKAGGTYVVTGTLEDGRIIVDAKGEDVTLVLNGASITCTYGSPLYIYKAASVTVNLAAGGVNALYDGATYAYDDGYSTEADAEPNACLYSKADLVINGAGTLTVVGSYQNGITGKDALTIQNATLNVTAVNNGVTGRDSLSVISADITVSCGGDAVQATNDEDASLGFVYISDSTLDLVAGEDGVQAETTLTLYGNSVSIISGGGSGETLAEDATAKGLKAGGDLYLDGGLYSLDCADDAVHSNADITLVSGSFTVSSGDDAFHSDATLSIKGGSVAVLASYEGLEGLVVSISGGSLDITASDDGINAAGGADSSGAFGGDLFSNDGSAQIEISGGYIVVDADGDGIDSNGSVTQSGGTLIVFGPTNDGNGALDYNGTYTLEGGTLLAIGSAGMAQTPNDTSLYTVSVTFGQTLSAGTIVSLESDAHSFVFELRKDAASLIFASADIEEGESYAISYGGAYSGAFTDGIGTGGAYSGGTALGTLTIEDALNTYGAVGTGGSMGGSSIGTPGGTGSFPGGVQGGGRG